MATRHGAFVDGVDQFDAPFFGIAPREAQTMDPQQRLLLEVAWEALEHANIPATALHGSDAGVFIGITCFDHAVRMARAPERMDAHAGTGSALNMAAGRLSYVLGATGPSMAIDTACSSSLVALHVACHSLRQRETSLALVGGVHLMLSPEVMVSFSQARMLSPDGRCKTFAASADGYGRGEGCGVLVLKRLRDAQAAGDRIVGVLRATAVNQDGPSGGLTVPSGAAQRAVMRRALDAAGLQPADIDYVEAHGTGTPLGDPIELEALASVYGAGRADTSPLLVGSVKTNIGHLEPAAGVAALIKVLLSLDNEQLPPHLHLDTPTTHVDWARTPLRVPTAAVPWARGVRPRRAAVSAFGFSGTNAHVIVEEPPPRAAVRAVTARPHLLPLSARSEPALRALAGRMVSWCDAHPEADLASVCTTAATGRAHLPWRLTVCSRDLAELRAVLVATAEGRADSGAPLSEVERLDYRTDVADLEARLRAAETAAAAPAVSMEARLAALAEVSTLYRLGLTVDWQALADAGASRDVTLPTYPFQRRRLWIDLPEEAAEDVWPASWFYRTTWAAVEAPVTSSGPTVASRRWSVVADDAALGDAIRRTLTDAGASVELVPAGRHKYDGAARDAASGDSSAHVADTVTDVVVAVAASAPAEATAACAELLALAQHLATRAAPPRVWVVTRGAAPALGLVTDAGALQAPLGALARVIAMEYPAMAGRVIDLDPMVDAPTADAEALLREWHLVDQDDWVAFRGGVRYAPRLARCEIPAPPPVSLVPTATYLVTGGLGELGLRVAAWLAARGAHRLCLVGRQGVRTDAQRMAVDALQRRGVTVDIVAADVADAAALRSVIEHLPAAAPIRGVIHAAGVAGWADLPAISADALRDVLRPKLDGVWAMDRATRHSALDFFVCFSSVASAWGSRSQAHYAAANAGLDAAMQARRHRGLPGLAVQWGPWGGGGMTSGDAAAVLARAGLHVLDPDRALHVLDAALASAPMGVSDELVVADVAWDRFAGVFEARGPRGLLDRVRPASTDTGGDAPTPLAIRVAAAVGDARLRLVVDDVSRVTADVLGLPAGTTPPADQGLFEMGLDSLLAMDLRARLETLSGCALPATLAVDCPTIAALAALLVTRMAPSAPVPAAPVARADHHLEHLSDSEAEALLLARLGSLSAKG